MARRWAIYDFDADEMATTTVYASPEDAFQDAFDLDNGMIVCLGHVQRDPEDDENDGS